MKCPNCGNQIESGTIFCEGCGQRISYQKIQSEQSSTESYVPEKKEKKLNKSMRFLIFIVVAVILALTVFDGIIKDKKSTQIDINDYISQTIVFSGANGYGSISANSLVYYSSFYSDLSADADYTSDKLLRDCIKITLPENNGSLCNGDVIEVVFEIDTNLIKENKMTTKTIVEDKTSVKYNVSGLKEGTVIEILPDIAQYISYSGGNGFGKANLKIPDTYQREYNGYYIVSSSYGNGLSIMLNNEALAKITPEIIASTGNGKLSKDDIIKLSIKDQEEILAKYNIVFAQPEIDIVVPDLGNYMESATQLTETQLDTIKSKILQAAESKSNSGETFEYMETYSGTLKPTVESENKTNGAVFGVVKKTTFNAWKSEYSYRYLLYAVYDVLVKEDGSIEYDVDKYDYAKSCNTLEELSTYMNSEADYTFEKIG